MIDVLVVSAPSLCAEIRRLLIKAASTVAVARDPTDPAFDFLIIRANATQPALARDRYDEDRIEAAFGVTLTSSVADTPSTTEIHEERRRGKR